MLSGISEFTIVPEYKIRGTTFWVKVPGSDQPVARIRRDVGVTGSVGDLHRVFIGSNLDEFAGFVTPSRAFDAAKTKIGHIELGESGYATVEHPMVFCQEDMQPLTERVSGLIGKIVRMPVMGYVLLFLNPVVLMVGMVLGGRRASEFKGAHSPGFRIAKTTHVTNHFRLSIHDSRINFLLAFSCLLVAHDNWGSLSLRKFGTRFASHLDPQSWKGPRGLAKRK